MDIDKSSLPTSSHLSYSSQKCYEYTKHSNNSTSINNNTNNDGFFIEDEGNSRGFLFNVDDVPEWAQNMGLNDVNQLLDPTVIAIFGIFLTLLGTVAQMVRGR